MHEVTFSSVILPHLHLKDRNRTMRETHCTYFSKFTFRASPSPDTGTERSLSPVSFCPASTLQTNKRKMRHRDTSLYFPEFTFRASPSPDTGTSGREHETKKRRMVFKVTWWEEEKEREDMKSLADTSWWSH